MKFAAVCAIIVALALVQVCSAEDNEWGKRESGDRQLYREIVIKKYSFLQIVTKDVSYSGAARITYIKVTDQYTDGNGGSASLYAGGAGYTDVTIHLKSQRNHGFNFIIEVFGL